MRNNGRKIKVWQLEKPLKNRENKDLRLRHSGAWKTELSARKSLTLATPMAAQGSLIGSRLAPLGKIPHPYLTNDASKDSLLVAMGALLNHNKFFSIPINA